MFGFARQLIDRAGLVLGLVLALSFALAPAMEAHACTADEGCVPAVQILADTPSDTDPDCPDCGPACAGSCCHAPHPVMTAGLAPLLATAERPTPTTWRHAVVPAPVRPAGHERPPRI